MQQILSRIAMLCILTLLACGSGLRDYQELSLTPTQGLSSSEDEYDATFRVGCGIHDITGPPAERMMMGYVKIGQNTGGIHMRLRSRAFIIESLHSNNRIVFVSADLGMIFQAVKQRVVTKLQACYGSMYTSENVILSATHTHSGPGGYSHYLLYYVSALGFDQQNLDIIVDGIYCSIVKAHENLQEGTIKIASGELEDASWNRSILAYRQNKDRDEYPCDTDKLMTVLRLENLKGRELGMITWFPVHATSIRNDNALISGDNKGVASYLFEKHMGTDYAAKETYVAAFAQSHEGDVTPNYPQVSDIDSFERARRSGMKQFQKALYLYESAIEPLRGNVNYRHAYVGFSNLRVKDRWTGQGKQYTSPAAIGISMLAGAEDGPGLEQVKEGWTTANLPILQKLVAFKGIDQLNRMIENKEAYGELKLSRSRRWPLQWLPWLGSKRLTIPVSSSGDVKPVVLDTGDHRHPWTPQILPIQIATIGQLAIVAVPAEFTTMAGRRLMQAVLDVLGPAGILHIVIAGLANAYSGYVTTNEEYNQQHYEGASTHFGPWTLTAYQQQFFELATQLREGKPASTKCVPLDLKDYHRVSVRNAKPPRDRTPPEGFGSIAQDASPVYQRGETVHVEFYGGHPNHSLGLQPTYLEVQRQEGAAWVTVASDWDEETKFIWKPCHGLSHITVEWTIPTDACESGPVPAGTYRICHYGHWKGQKQVTKYTGTSRVFEVLD